MKRLLLIFICLNLFSCVERILYLPFPTDFILQFDIVIDENQEFSVDDVVNSSEIAVKIVEQLDEEQIEQITEIDLEAMSYELIFTDDIHSLASANFELFYPGFQPVNIFSVQDSILGNIINEEKAIVLSSEAVNILNQAFDDVLNNVNSDIRVLANG